MSNLIVPYNGPVLPYFGIAQDALKWEWLGFEAVRSESLPRQSLLRPSLLILRVIIGAKKKTTNIMPLGISHFVSGWIEMCSLCNDHGGRTRGGGRLILGPNPNSVVIIGFTLPTLSKEDKRERECPSRPSPGCLGQATRKFSDK
jgi:hypothetical protein